MATTVRPFLLSGVALASAATMTLAAPAALSGVPTPLQLSSAKYELTALSDITVQGITDALTVGWGGFIGPADPFYPGQFTNNVLVNGFGGAAYYVLDQAGIVPFNLENYFFEVGSQTPSNPLLAGLGAAAYVGVGSVFGADSAPAQLVKSLIGGGSFDIGTAIVSLTAGVPVLGDLASVYFTGKVTGSDTTYGTGLAGVFAYAGTLLPALAGLDLTGLLSGVTGLINSIGNLINGHGGGSHSGSQSHSDESDEVDSPDVEDSADESTGSNAHQNGSGNQNGDSHQNGNGHGGHASAAAAVTARAAAAVAPAKSVEAAETNDSAPAGTAADSTAPKRGAKRGAEAAGSGGHGSRAKAGHSAD